jgi:hypothetical protein
MKQNNREYEVESKLQMERLQGIEDKFTRRLETAILERKEREDSVLRMFEERAVSLKYI